MGSVHLKGIMNGFIYLDRKIIDWEWYTDINVCRLFIHILLLASWEDKPWRGQIIKRGQLITSIPSLCAGTALTPREVRTGLEKLQSTHEIDRQTTNKYSVITVLNYDKYQNSDRQTTDKRQAQRQSNDSLTTASEEIKNINNISCPTKPDVKKDKAIDERKLHNFEKIYSVYPKKTGSKQDAITHYLGWISSRGRCMNGRYIKLTNEQMYAAVKKYVNQMEDEGRELKYYQGFDRFMNKTILDYVEERHDTS